MFDLSRAHPSWHPILNQCLAELDPDYIQQLTKNPSWLPGPEQIFSAFSLPLSRLKSILFGESPYPRIQSANGYAFWDGAVHHIWSANGLATGVNRATSLRNIIKMLLVAGKWLPKRNTSQQAIAKLEKQQMIQTLDELFNNLMGHGVLLLNASLVLTQQSVRKDAKAWRPFIAKLLQCLAERQQSVQLILLGQVAKQIDSIDVSNHFPRFYAEHPYNISFITNSQVLKLFAPLNLLLNSR